MPLTKQLMSFPLTGGLASKDSPLSQVPGTFIDLQNVRQERSDEWRLRNGMTSDANDTLPGTPPVRFAQLPGGGAVAMDIQFTSVPAALTYLPGIGTTRWTRAGVFNAAQGTPSVWSRQPIVRAERPISVSYAQGGGFSLSAHFRASATAGLYVHLASIGNGAASPAVQSFVAAAGIVPKCVYHAGSSRLMLFYVDTGNLRVVAWDASTGAQVTLPTTLTGGVNAIAYLDAIPYSGSPQVTVVYRTAASTIGYLEVTPATLALATNVVLAVNCANCLSLLPEPDASGVRFIALANAVPETRVLRVSSAGAILTNDVAAGASTFQIGGCAYQAGAGWMIVYEGATGITAVKKRFGVVSAPAIVVSGTQHHLDTNAWRLTGHDLMRYVLGLHRTATGDAQATYYEMAIPFEDGSANVNNSFPEPQARMLPLNAGPGPGQQACLPQVFQVSAGRFVTALVRLARLNAPASGTQNQFAIDSWAVDYTAPSATNPVKVGEGTISGASAFIPAGNLLIATTGETLATHGSSAIPYQPTLTQSAAGALTATNSYQVLVQIEYPDENGNVWRCYGIPAKITLTAGNQTISVAVSLSPTELAARLVTVNIYATLGNGSLFRKVNSRTDRADALTSFTYVHSMADATAAGGEPLSAEVPTTITPPLTHVTTFGGRQFGINRDFPSQVWFTKPIALPLQPEYPGGAFVITQDDQFGEFTQLAALDDRLILFKQNARYVVLGDGPDNSGAGSFNVSRIDSDIGAIPGSPVVSTGKEVFFVSQRGIWRTDLSLSDDYVGVGIDQYLNQPSLASVLTQQTVIGAVFSSRSNEVRFLTSGDGSFGWQLVYDRLRSIWFVDKSAGFLGAVATRMVGTKQALFMPDSRMLFEGDDSVTDDAGAAYAGVIASAWLRPAGPEGRFRLYRARVVSAQPVTGPDVTPIMAIYFDDDDSPNGAQLFSPTTPVSGGAKLVRAEVRPRNKPRCSSFRLLVTLQPGTKMRLDKWAAEIGIPDGAAKKIPAAQRWRS